MRRVAMFALLLPTASFATSPAPPSMAEVCLSFQDSSVLLDKPSEYALSNFMQLVLSQSKRIQNVRIQINAPEQNTASPGKEIVALVTDRERSILDAITAAEGFDLKGVFSEMHFERSEYVVTYLPVAKVCDAVLRANFFYTIDQCVPKDARCVMHCTDTRCEQAK